MIYIAVIETRTPQLFGILKKKHRRKVKMGGFETVQVTVMRGYLVNLCSSELFTRIP